MEVIAVEYFTTSIDTGNNEEKYKLHSYISDENEQDACDLHAHMAHIKKKVIIRKKYCLVCQQYGNTVMVV